MGIDGEPLPGDPAELDPAPRALDLACDRERSDDVAAAADPEHEGAAIAVSEGVEEAAGPAAGARQGGQVSAGSGSEAEQVSRIVAAARSNSSSAITGTPSKGRSRSISTQE